MKTVSKMYWLLVCGHGSVLYTDCNNLVFLFDPISFSADLLQTTLQKVLRLTVKLSAYSYTCIHEPGTDNVLADLLGPWTAPRVLRCLVSVPVLSSSNVPDFDCPKLNDLAASRHTDELDRKEGLSLNGSGLFVGKSRAIWIPVNVSTYSFFFALYPILSQVDTAPQQQLVRSFSNALRRQS